MQNAPTSTPSLADILARIRVFGERYLVTLRKYWWIPAITVGFAFIFSLWKGTHLPPSYVSTAQMVITGQFQIEGAARSDESENYIGTQFALIQGDQVAQRARKKVLAAHPDWMPVQVGISISQPARTSFMLLQASGPEPLYTQAFLDAVMAEYMALKKEMRVEKSDNMTSAIRNQLILLEKKTDADQKELSDFQKENNMGYVQTQVNSAAEFLASLDRRVAELKTEQNLLNTLNLDQNIARSQITGQPSTPGNPTTNAPSANPSMSTLDPSLANSYYPLTEYQKAKQEVMMLKAKRDERLKIITPINPEIKDLERQISRAETLMETFRGQSVDVLKTRKEAIDYQIRNFQKVMAEWEVKAMEVSQKMAEYDRIKIKLDRDNNEFNRLVSTEHSVNLSRNVEQDRLSILENASPAEARKANLAKTLFSGLGMGLMAGLAVVFLIDKLDDRIGSVIECRSHFRELDILGQIPRDDMNDEMPLLIPYDPRHELLEAFRALRSSIIFAPVDGVRPKSLMITSAMAGEGKTAIAYNLAATLSFSGAKTLLVDCNLSSGRLHHVFGVMPEEGFLNVLQQQMPWRKAIVKTCIDNLFLLPRGNALAYPAEHFFEAFLKEVYQEFDFIIFDSASILENVDALSFAPIIDGVLFVVRLTQTSSGTARRALDFLNARQVNVLGVVCNEV